jgi:4-hydroxybutyryl-CoA synthetase (ADP-forming)
VYDIEAIAECLKRLSQLIIDFEKIREIDINPLIVYEKGSGGRIVDARIILEGGSGPAPRGELRNML